jgi:hypothetical protein
MKFLPTCITAFLLSAATFSSCHASSPVYDYDHVDSWNTDFAGDNGDCDGTKQSPIALETMDCTHYANYELNVSAGDKNVFF